MIPIRPLHETPIVSILLSPCVGIPGNSRPEFRRERDDFCKAAAGSRRPHASRRLALPMLALLRRRAPRERGMPLEPA